LVQDWHESNTRPTRSPASDARAEAQRIHRLVGEQLASVTRYLGRLGVAPGEIDDVAQEAFIVASAKIASVPVERENAFLYTVVAHVAQNVRRASMRRQRAHDRFGGGDTEPEPSPEQLADSKQTRTLADSILRDMSSDLKGVFVLCELEGLAIPEVAIRLAVPIGTVASRLRRARKEFFDRLARASAPRRHPRSGGRILDAEALGPEILNWWVSDGEVEALGALVGMYRRGNPGTSVRWTGIRETSVAKASLQARMSSGAPPDMFQSNGGRDLLRWDFPASSPGGHLESLESLFERERWRACFSDEVLDLVSSGGEAYAVPLNIHRINTLSYDLHTFARTGVDVPKTIDELHGAVAALKRAGVSPIALGVREPWVLTMLAFEFLLVGIAGPGFYRDFFEGKGSPRSPEIAQALAELGRLLDVSNRDAPTLGWDRAADRVRIGSAAMTLMGDWTKGYFERRGYLEGEGFGVAAAPGTEGAYVFTVDAFGIPRGAANRDRAVDLLRIFGSDHGQTVFSRIKGSRPARITESLTVPDRRGEFETAVRVPTLTSIIPPSFSGALDAALAEFAASRDAEVVFRAIERNYPDALR